MDADRYTDEMGTWFTGFSAVMAMGLVMFVYRTVRNQVTQDVAFHGFFFLGLAFLGYALWAVLTLYPIVDNTLLITDWSKEIFPLIFSAPLACLLAVPLGLLSIGFAIFQDAHPRFKKTI